MDLAINQDIPEEAPKFDRDGKRMGIFIEDFPELKLEPKRSTMYYYETLRAAKQKKQESAGSKDSLGGEPGNKQGSSGSKLLDEILDKKSKGAGRSGDWHDLWDELTQGMSEREKEILKKELHEKLVKIAEEAKKSKGDVPAHLEQAIKDDFGRTEPVVPWQVLFNRFVGSSISTDIKTSRKRPNFRFEDAPVNKYKFKVKVIVGVDTSGSVSNEELKSFFAQIHTMWKAGGNVEICLWDAEAEEPYQYKGELSFKRTKCGGTRASCFIEYVNKHRSKKHWTCAINLTDGYIESDPIRCTIPMLWVITKDGSTEFNHPSKKIRMND